MTGMADTASEDAQQEDFRPASRADRESRERAAFLNGEPLSDDETPDEAPDADRHAGAPKVAAKSAPKAKPTARVEESESEPELDDDDDLDDDIEDDDDEEVTAADESDDEEEDSEDADEDDADEDDEPAKGKVDPARAKAAAAVARQEARMRAQLAADRATMQADFERKQADLKPRFDKLDAFEKVAARANVDPLGLLRHAGVTDMEYVGRLAWAEHQAASDPKHKEAGLKLRADRERDDRLAKVEQELADKKAAEEKKDKEAKQAAEFSGLMARIGKVATKSAEAPLVKTLLANNEKRAHQLLAHAHVALWDKTGAEPHPTRVVKLAEKMQRAHLRELGIDPKSLDTTTTETASASTNGKKSAAPAKGAKPANGKKSAPKAEEDADIDMSDDDLKSSILNGIAAMRGN